MEEPLHMFFSVMNEAVFTTTEYEMKVGNGTVCELIDPSGEVHTSGGNSMTKEVQLCPNHTTTPTTETVHRKTHNTPPLILMFPPNDADGIYNTPFQFDRQARARISTSPTLRRLRKNTAGHFMPSQDILDVTKLPTSKEQSALNNLSGHLWDSPLWSPQSTVSTSPSSSDNPEEVPISENDGTDIPKDPEENMNDDCPDDALLHNRLFAVDQSVGNPDNICIIGPTTEIYKDDDSSNQSTKIKDHSRLLERRRSSVVLSLPGLEVFPGDLLVSDGASDYMYHSTWVSSTDSKKPKWPFSKKGTLTKGKQKHMSDLENCLSSVKIQDFTGNELYILKDKTWNEVICMYTAENIERIQKPNRRRQESVWELFTSECTYYLDHLLVLKKVFFNALQHLQNNDHLLDVDLVRLFANLEELLQESLHFATGLLNTIKSRELGCSATVSLPLADLLTKHFKDNRCLSHQVYCMNYTSAVIYLESIKQRDDFTIYLKWCEQHEQCKRLHLSDLLVAPLHRLTRYPLLLKNIWKRSTDATEKIAIVSTKDKVESSLRDLEGKVKWLDKSQKYKQLQEVIVWPSLWERDKRFFIPEGLKHHFKEPNVESMLSSPNRDLLHEGRLILTESSRLLDVYLFLFDDFLLITKIKRNKKKSTNVEINQYPSLHPELQMVTKEGGYCKVVDQPIPLDRLSLKTVDQFHTTVYGMKNAFMVQHENRYQQCIGAFILQTHTESEKKTWMSQIETAVSCYTETHRSKRLSTLWQTSESAEI